MNAPGTPAGPGKRPLLPWLRFLHLRTYGRTHLAIAWRVTGSAAGPHPVAEGMQHGDALTGTRQEPPGKRCARRSGCAAP